MNPEWLKKMANLGNGNYALIKSNFPDFSRILKNTNNLNIGTVKVDNFKVNEQQGILFLWIALCCLLIYSFWTATISGFLDKLTRLK
jgi:hypothetical protein